MNVADPPAFGVVPQQDLGHCRREQLAVGQLGLSATAGAGYNHVIVDQYMECSQEGVQFLAHTLILNTLLPCPRTGRASHDLHGINRLAGCFARGQATPDAGQKITPTPRVLEFIATANQTLGRQSGS